MPFAATMNRYRIETFKDSTKQIDADFMRTGPNGVVELVRRLNVPVDAEHPGVTQIVDQVVFVCGPLNLAAIEIVLDSTPEEWTSRYGYQKNPNEKGETPRPRWHEPDDHPAIGVPVLVEDANVGMVTAWITAAGDYRLWLGSTANFGATLSAPLRWCELPPNQKR